LRAGNEAISSVHRAFRLEEVRESAFSTVFKNEARNRSRCSNASLISDEISSEVESNPVVSPRSWSIESWSRPSRRLRLKVWVTKSSSYETKLEYLFLEVIGVIDSYLVIMFRLDPIVDIAACFDQTKTVCSENLEGQRLVIWTTFTSIKVCLIKA
jgi:hypothetical protein